MKHSFTPLSILILCLTMVLFVSSCKKDVEPDIQPGKTVDLYKAEVAQEWYDLFLELERYAAGYRPGPAPRALGLIGLAAYEACVSGMPGYNSLRNRYHGLQLPVADKQAEYFWPAVVHGVYSEMFPLFFTNPPATLDSKLKALTSRLTIELSQSAGNELFQRSFVYGKAVGKAVWDWSTTDIYGHDAYFDPFANYDWAQNYKKPGDWVPTVPGPPQPMFPHWGKVRTFAISEGLKLSKPPLPFSENPNSALYAQALEVYANHRASFEGQWIAEFWSDDHVNLTFSPGSRWIAIAQQIIQHKDSDLATALEAYAKTGMALNDAAIACWHSKYYYNVERPDTYIKRVIDPNWKPSLDNPITGDIGFTPPFPSYPSGHSTMGAAGAEALASVFGYAYGITDKCHENRNEFLGMPRTFGSLFEMAQENAWSRVPLGVHFRMDSEEGVRHGTVIGREVNKLPWKK